MVSELYALTNSCVAQQSTQIKTFFLCAGTQHHVDIHCLNCDTKLVSAGMIQKISSDIQGVCVVHALSAEPGSIQAVGRNHNVRYHGEGFNRKARAVVCICQLEKPTEEQETIGHETVDSPDDVQESRGATLWLKGSSSPLCWKGDQSALKIMITHFPVNTESSRFQNALADVGSRFKVELGIKVLLDNGLIEFTVGKEVREHSLLIEEVTKRWIFTTGN